MYCSTTDPVVIEKRIKIETLTDGQTDRRTNNCKKAIRKDQLCF